MVILISLSSLTCHQPQCIVIVIKLHAIKSDWLKHRAVKRGLLTELSGTVENFAQKSPCTPMNRLRSHLSLTRCIGQVTRYQAITSKVVMAIREHKNIPWLSGLIRTLFTGSRRITPVVLSHFIPVLQVTAMQFMTSIAVMLDLYTTVRTDFPLIYQSRYRLKWL